MPASTDQTVVLGELQFWLALEEVTPEMGPMRFINKSHREGPLGSVFNQDSDDLAGGVRGCRALGNLLDQYPLLPEVLGVSEPGEMHYMPRDVTVYHVYCAHPWRCQTTLPSAIAYPIYSATRPPDRWGRRTLLGQQRLPRQPWL